MYVSICLFLHVFAHMSMLGMCVPVYMYISMCVYMHACIYAHVLHA